MVGRVRWRGAAAVTALLGAHAVALLAAMRVALRVGMPASVVIAHTVLLGLASLGALYLADRAARTVETLFAHQDHLMLAVAHEVRSPLSRALVILEEGLGGAAPPERAIAEARANVVELSGLIEDLLEVARIMSGAVDPPAGTMRLDEVVRDLPGTDQIGPVQVCFETRPTVVRGSPHLVRRAVSNLVRNAASHGYGGRAGEIRVRVDEEGVTVQDDGPGIPSAQLDRLRYEAPLHARDRRRSGLGLLLAGWVANLHHGRLVLRNRPEGGFEARLRIRGVATADPDGPEAS